MKENQDLLNNWNRVHSVSEGRVGTDVITLEEDSSLILDFDVVINVDITVQVSDSGIITPVTYTGAFTFGT